MLRITTFSIVAHDPTENAWGVAVASKFLAVGAVVPWARAGVGAVATQAFAKVGFGSDGLALMGEGLSATETLAKLIADDPNAEDRQVGLVDAQGGAVAHTGSDCFEWAGHRVGRGYTCQGNLLTGPETLEAMASAYEAAQGDLAARLFAALDAGDKIGGDRRGKQSAALLVVKLAGGYGGDNDRYLDLRVDDDPDPLAKMAELLKLHHLYFGAADPATILPLDDSLIRELQNLLARLKFYEGAIDGQWGEASRAAFWALCGNENLEERADITYEGDRIDPVVLDYLRRRFGTSA